MKDKKFNQTKVGQFLSKNGSKLLNIVGDVAPPLEFLTNLIAGDPDLTPEQKQEAQKLALEEYRLEIQDRQGARDRQVAMAQAGAKDTLLMISGITGLSLLVFVVISVFFFELKNSELAHFIAGEAITAGLIIITYHFGSSRGSKDKQTKLDNLLK